MVVGGREKNKQEQTRAGWMERENDTMIQTEKEKKKITESVREKGKDAMAHLNIYFIFLR